MELEENVKHEITKEQADNFRKAINYFRKIPPRRIHMYTGSRYSWDGKRIPVCVGCHLSECFDIPGQATLDEDGSMAIRDYLPWLEKHKLLEKMFGITEQTLFDCGAKDPNQDRDTKSQSIFHFSAWEKHPKKVFKNAFKLCEII